VPILCSLPRHPRNSCGAKQVSWDARLPRVHVCPSCMFHQPAADISLGVVETPSFPPERARRGGDDSHPAMRVDDPNPPMPALRMSSGTAAGPAFHPSPCEDCEVFTGEGFPPLACACLGFCRDSRGWRGSGSARERTVARKNVQQNSPVVCVVEAAMDPWQGKPGFVTTPLSKGLRLHLGFAHRAASDRRPRRCMIGAPFLPPRRGILGLAAAVEVPLIRRHATPTIASVL
jgi:hypothetical protein